MVSLDRGMVLRLLAADSPKISVHISIAAGSMRSSALAWAFLHLEMRWATRYDARSAFSCTVHTIFN